MLASGSLAPEAGAGLGPVVTLRTLSHTQEHNQPMRAEDGGAGNQWEAGTRGWCQAPTALALGILISVHPSVVRSSETVRSERRPSQETESDTESEPGVRC